MQNFGTPSKTDLSAHGLHDLRSVYWNLYPAQLVEEAIRRGEGSLTQLGSLVVATGKYTGRSPNDKFVVQYDDADDADIWWGNVNRPITPAKFESLFQKMIAYYAGKDAFVQDLAVGNHPAYRMPIRIICENAWTSLFARDLFVRLKPEEWASHVPQFTVIQATGCHADPALDGTNSEAFIVVNFHRKLILIGTSAYAGEVKKSIFTIMNYLMPRRGVLSMHCSANIGREGDTALFFGLSGTGKTTLSSDPERGLIGDDEHGWGDDGVFNFEGGCYAKTIKLSPKYEPLISAACRNFGTVLENVVFDPVTRAIDFDSDKLTENTRAAYPIEYIPGFVPEGRGGHPRNVFFLTADAFGVLPPIAKLTPEQAMYYFLSGYTSKLAGTERGIVEPQTTFSACFGSPFLPLKPGVYAELLKQKISKHNAQVWLVNTGWTGGPYGVGHRFELPYTRAIIKAALTGALEKVPTTRDPFFDLPMPVSCPDVPSEVLDPISTWQDKADYEKHARDLAGQFAKNFEQYREQVGPEVLAAGPKAK
jgi:phosphoenolpyruvate carboxykinase (ATP)